MSMGIRTISDLKLHLHEIRPGFGPEFMNRPDGYRGLVRAYDLQFGQAPREMDRNLLYQAIAQGSLDLAAGDSTDGRIAALDLVQLEVTNRLAGAIDATAMRAMNREVDERKQKPEEVAKRFLRGKGLLPRG